MMPSVRPGISRRSPGLLQNSSNGPTNSEMSK
jgi:hypothetical protein